MCNALDANLKDVEAINYGFDDEDSNQLRRARRQSRPIECKQHAGPKNRSKDDTLKARGGRKVATYSPEFPASIK